MKTKQKSGSKPVAAIQPSSNGTYNIGDRAVLIDLTIHRWTPTVVDKKASQEVADRHSSDVTMGRYEKDLVDKKALAEVNSASNELRRVHNYYSAPWTDGGVRIVSGAGYFQHNKKIMDAKAAFDKAADNFVQKFDKHVDRTQKRQGTLFDRSEYPTTERLRKAYGVDIRVLPVPDPSQYSGALAVMLGDEMVQIQKSTAAVASTAIETAMKDTYSRLFKVVETAAVTLKEFERGDDGKVKAGTNFKSSLTGNILELLEIMPALNLTGDPQLMIFADRIKKEIASADIDSLKFDNTLRKGVVKSAEDILEKMNSYLG